MIEWTDQMKELLNDQNTMAMNDTGGPMQEMALWQSRSAKMLEFSQQLQKPEVRHVQDILQHTKSLYLERFCKLAKEIQVEEVCTIIIKSAMMQLMYYAVNVIIDHPLRVWLCDQDFSQEAQLNVKFLSILKEPCEELAQLKPSQITSEKLKHIIHLIRVIWINSKYFNTSERMTGLFCKVSAFSYITLHTVHTETHAAIHHSYG